MKNSFKIGVALAAVTLLPHFSLQAADIEPGKVEFGTFSPAPGSQFVEVNIKSNLINLVSKLVKNEPEVQEVLAGLREIKVNVLELNDQTRGDLTKRFHAIRSELDGKGWDRIVTVQQDDNDVTVSLKMKDTAVEGIVVTVMEGKQAVLVNIVGDIKPEKIAVLGERFDIEPLKKLPIKPAKS
ncbi:MAG: DUF4252 domain-containing protein [Verrucomicrobiales bacterium]